MGSSRESKRVPIMRIDPAFDFHTEIPPRADPDKYSKTLRQYHKELWSKPLPTGGNFALSDAVSGKYLFHQSSLGEFSLSSDTIAHSYVNVKRMQPVVGLLSDERKETILRKLHTIGSYTVFPSNRIDQKPTINGARGLNARIFDRFDLTLECVRRHYIGAESPLSEVFNRYAAFFTLFGDFRGYVEFFLLHDLVDPGFSTVKYFLPFDDSFPVGPLPESVDAYNVYIDRTIEFVGARGLRMSQG
jgi:hypothetical protein